MHVTLIWSRTGEEFGRLTLDESGIVQPDGLECRSITDGLWVFPEGTPSTHLHYEDGEAYLRALPTSLNSTAVGAFFHEEPEPAAAFRRRALEADDPSFLRPNVSRDPGTR